MTAARTRFSVELIPDVQQIDIAEMRRHAPHCLESFRETLELIQARRDEAAKKKGRLEGAYSASFRASPDDDRETGRVIYSIAAPVVTIWAAYHEHDEAYRRAKARYRKVIIRPKSG